MAKNFQLIDDLNLAKLKPPAQLIEGILPCGGFAVLVGPSGVGKSFLAIETAMSVATGRKWLKSKLRSVTKGPVVYVVAEGVGGFPARIRAWKKHREFVGPAGVQFLPHEVNLSEPGDVSKLLAAIGKLDVEPVLVVIDTLARCIQGADENSAKDIGKVVAQVDRIRNATAAAVLLVHHTGVKGARERGSSALRCAADAILFVDSNIKLGLHVSCEKQKEQEAFAPISLRLDQIELKDGQTSCVIRLRKKPAQQPEAALAGKAKQVFAVLKGIEGGASFKVWWKATGFPKATFTNARKALVGGGLVLHKNDKYLVAAAKKKD